MFVLNVTSEPLNISSPMGSFSGIICLSKMTVSSGGRGSEEADSLFVHSKNICITFSSFSELSKMSYVGRITYTFSHMLAMNLAVFY